MAKKKDFGEQAIELLNEKSKKAKKRAEPELLHYTIKAVIPTGQYANIQPEIAILAENLEEASKYVLPHIDALYHKYAPSLLPVVTVAPMKPEPITTSGYAQASGTPGVGSVTTTASASGEATVIHTADVSPSFLKANQAINSCLSSEALILIEKQISNSVKLNHDEKFALLKLVEIKATELSRK